MVSTQYTSEPVSTANSVTRANGRAGTTACATSHLQLPWRAIAGFQEGLDSVLLYGPGLFVPIQAQVVAHREVGEYADGGGSDAGFDLTGWLLTCLDAL